VPQQRVTENRRCFTELFDVRLLDRQLARYEIVRVHQEMLCWLASDRGEFGDDGDNGHKMERANSLD